MFNETIEADPETKDKFWHISDRSTLMPEFLKKELMAKLGIDGPETFPMETTAAVETTPMSTPAPPATQGPSGIKSKRTDIDSRRVTTAQAAEEELKHKKIPILPGKLIVKKTPEK